MLIVFKLGSCFVPCLSALPAGTLGLLENYPMQVAVVSISRRCSCWLGAAAGFEQHQRSTLKLHIYTANTFTRILALASHAPDRSCKIVTLCKHGHHANVQVGSDEPSDKWAFKAGQVHSSCCHCHSQLHPLLVFSWHLVQLSLDDHMQFPQGWHHVAESNH